ncbi:MAG TPA: hypothetical protein VJC09_02380 [Candidatus Saccharimonadales bacterium]|nr:hypothetical protein [Candidatus Saccharimonadales bacterium]
MNKEIEINAFTFINKQGFKTIPRAITVDDHRYSFIDLGLRYLIQKGEHLTRLFDMTDGQSVYRLKNEDDHWTLVSIKNAS